MINPPAKISEKYKRPLEEVIENILTKFGKEVLSIILFGSIARGDYHEYSDLDLMVITRNLPEDWRERNAISLELKGDIGGKYGIPIFVCLFEPEEVEFGLRNLSPFLFGIRKGYIALHDNGFFAEIMHTLEKRMREFDVVEIKPYVWEVRKIEV
ncbi:MAG: nucleotidyltransferase domain-containing protein [Methanocellales archaeon]|nr:nucleotidyltransferase domain-containing protein [Methanocellales archaeon]